MSDAATPRVEQMSTIKDLQEKVWDLEEQLDDAKATNQSQAAQIEVHLAQIHRLRRELRAKERERHTIETQLDPADPASKIEQKDIKKSEQKGVERMASKDVKETEQDIEFEELARGPALFHEADDIREHIIEVKSSSTHTFRGSTRVGHAGPQGLKRHASDDVSTQQSPARPFHQNNHNGPHPRAASASQAGEFSTTTPPPAPTFRHRLHAAPIVHPTSNSSSSTEEVNDPTPSTEGQHEPSHDQGRRRRQKPLGILIGTLRHSGSSVGRSNAVYGSRDRHGRVNRRISKGDQHGRVVSEERLRVTSCRHYDVDYIGRFRGLSKEIDSRILQMLADASMPTCSTSSAPNPSSSAATTKSQTMVKFEVEEDDEMDTDENRDVVKEEN